MLTPELVVLNQSKKGKKFCFECVYAKHGVTWLGFGLTETEAINDLLRAITNYFTPYDLR